MPNHGICAEQLSIAYGKTLVVEGLDLAIMHGKITALVGANGSGKSTILKAMSRLLSIKAGAVYLDGHSIATMKNKEVAKKLAILPQNPVSPEGLTIRELVLFGRFPHQSELQSTTQEDLDLVQWALRVTNLTDLADRFLDEVSGGQRQRAWIAMSIVQNTEIIFLDEPTTYLDMYHQIEILQLLKKLNREEKRTIVMVVHDLNHATQYADHIVAIKRGKVLYQGSPSTVINEAMLGDVFGVKASIMQDSLTGTLLCTPIFALEQAP